jgi:hypothetical protein
MSTTPTNLPLRRGHDERGVDCRAQIIDPEIDRRQ